MWRKKAFAEPEGRRGGRAARVVEKACLWMLVGKHTIALFKEEKKGMTLKRSHKKGGDRQGHIQLESNAPAGRPKGGEGVWQAVRKDSNQNDHGKREGKSD